MRIGESRLGHEFRTAPAKHAREGVFLGVLGMLAFSVTMPATRFTIGSLDPVVVGLGREVVAGGLAGVLLVCTRARRPRGAQWRQVLAVALGVVVAWPLLTALALRHVESSHGIVMTGLLSAFTALFAVLRARERPSTAFWLSSAGGLVSIVAFALVRGAGSVSADDGLLVAAALLCAWGFAEGGVLAQELGAWQVIGWALVVGLPFLTPIVAWRVAVTGLDATPLAWVGFGYLSTFSAFLGFLPWYRALAVGGIAKIGQLQLLSPMLSLIWGAILLGEAFHIVVLAAVAAITFFAFLVQRTEVSRRKAT